jgi:hypothetical protein
MAGPFGLSRFRMGQPFEGVGALPVSTSANSARIWMLSVLAKRARPFAVLRGQVLNPLLQQFRLATISAGSPLLRSAFGRQLGFGTRRNRCSHETFPFETGFGESTWQCEYLP